MRFFFRCRSALAALLATLVLGTSALANPPATSVYLEDLTSPEVRQWIAAGPTTVLIPIGGTEQNGPHMVLGKHNTRARVLAGEIARTLGHTLVAPVVAYVPEGAISPPAAHMRYAGTLSIPEATFESLLEATARSLKQHGVRDVVLLGDHGGYQRSETRVADKLNREWARDPRCRVHALLAYYQVTQTTYVADLRQRGFTAAQIGTHAGLADTALAMAVDPSLVRPDAHALLARDKAGVSGDPSAATVALGHLGVMRIVETAVAAIREATRAPR